VIRAALALIFAIGVGYGASTLPAVYMGIGTVSLGLVFLLRGRLYLLSAIAALYFTVVHRIPPLVDVGGFSLRVDDLLFATLLIDSVMRLTRVPQARTATSALSRIFLPVVAFIAYIGMTLLMVARWHPSELGMALASFVRLGTVSLYILIAYTTLTTENRLRRFVWFLAFIGVMSVLLGAYQLYDSMAFERRFRGFLGVNPLGVVSGLLVVLGCVQFRRGIFRNRLASYLCLGFGLFGIFLAKSIGGMLATVTTVCFYQLVHIRRDMLGVIRVSLGIGVAAAVFLVLFFTLRTAPAQSLVALKGGGSFIQRLLMAQTGLEIFKQNPVWGVGWRMSELPEIMGATELGTLLRARFPEVIESVFPDHAEGGGTVHNMYVQFLAELGLVGTLLFALLILYLVIVIRRILNETADDIRLRGCAEYCALGLVFILVWWNTTPLFGGQLESFLCFVFLGALAAISNISSRASRV